MSELFANADTFRFCSKSCQAMQLTQRNSVLAEQCNWLQNNYLKYYKMTDTGIHIEDETNYSFC